MSSRLAGWLVLALVVASVSGCSGGHAAAPVGNQAPRPARVISTDPLALIPIDSELVAHVDIQKVRASPTWQKLEPKLLDKAGPHYAQLKAQCGYDPLLQLRSLSVGAKNLDSPEVSVVMVVRGLERAKTMACVEQARAKSPGELVVEHDIVTATDSSGEHAVFTFVDDATVVVLAGKAATAAALDKLLDTGVPLKQSPAFNDAVASVRVTDPVWFVMNGNSKLFDSVASLGFKPRAVLGSFDLASGLGSSLRVRLGSPDEAQRMATMGNSQLGMAKGMFDRLELTADKSDAVVEVRMTQAQLDTIMGMLGGGFGP